MSPRRKRTRWSIPSVRAPALARSVYVGFWSIPVPVAAGDPRSARRRGPPHPHPRSTKVRPRESWNDVRSRSAWGPASGVFQRIPRCGRERRSSSSAVIPWSPVGCIPATGRGFRPIQPRTPSSLLGRYFSLGCRRGGLFVPDAIGESKGNVPSASEPPHGLRRVDTGVSSLLVGWTRTLDDRRRCRARGRGGLPAAGRPNFRAVR